jgi:Cof subfamily protein (haloacid dehalogenase superfamily)
MVESRYLIALDLDGTLLNKDKVISPSTLRYLKKIKEKHVVVLATGRPYRSFKKYYDQLELTTPMVCYNGAYVTHPHDSSFNTSSFAFPKDVAISIYQTLGKSILDNVMCETNDFIWLLKKEDSLANFFWLNDMKILHGDLTKTLHLDPMTMILKSKFRSKESDAAIFKAVEAYPGLRVRFWGDSLFSEIFYEHVSKGAALVELLNYYNIPKSQFIAFGDAENDREMLQLAHHSFAMINGIDEIKKIAKYTTEKDNHHHGIIHTLKTKFKLL